MRRVNVVFVAVVVGATLTGGVTAAGFGTDLRTVDTITTVERRLGTTAVDLRLSDQTMLVEVRLTNPTGYRIGLAGTFVRVYDDDRNQLAYGTGDRVDDGPSVVPPRGSLDARYAVGLTPAEADRLRAALADGPVRLSLSHSLSLRGKSFQLVRSNVTVSASGAA